MNGRVDNENIIKFKSPASGIFRESDNNCVNISCHGDAAWNSSQTYTCMDCHNQVRITRRQVTGPGGDFTRDSHHVIDYNSRNSEIIQPADCVICHDQSQHAKGKILLKNKDGGESIIYTKPQDLEPFCLACHDSNGALTESTPFKPFPGSSNTLGAVPNEAGTKIYDSWNKNRGHGKAGLTCAGDGKTPGTGCHGNYNGTSGTVNAHGSGNYGLLANNLTLPIPDNTWTESRYKLCIDCHASAQPPLKTMTQLLGVAQGGNYSQILPQLTGIYNVDFMESSFHDYLGYGLDRQWNLHTYHLADGVAWNYRGLNSWPTSNGSCVTCHNVHGTDGQFYLWDEWEFVISVEGNIEFGKMTGAFPQYGNPEKFPEYCGNACHGNAFFGINNDLKYPRSLSNEARAYAFNKPGNTPGVLDAGDYVVISFSDSTNGLIINDSNIDQVLTLNNGHKWFVTGSITAAWSSSGGKMNNILTITFSDTSSTVAATDLINFWSTAVNLNDEILPTIEARVIDSSGNLIPVTRPRVLRFADGTCCQKDGGGNYIYGPYNIRINGNAKIMGSF